MAEIGIQALQADPLSVVAMAAAGEPVTITEGGRPVVRMVAYAGSSIEGLIATGRARPALRPLGDLPAPEPANLKEPTLSEELAKMRRAERY